MRWLRLQQKDEAVSTEGAAAADARWQKLLTEACDQIEADLDVMLGRLVARADAARGDAVATRAALEAMGGRAIAAATRAHGTGESTTAVAAAVEELAASGQEIDRQASRSRDVGIAAARATASTRTQMGELEAAAEQISGVVTLIEEIAARTNLLALNATIEAARAGAAGRGFAVVAAEVKALSDQTRKATVTIAERITAMRDVVGATLGSVEDIDRVMDVNFYGTLYMTKAFLPHLLKRPEAHLANVSSMGGFLPVPGQSIYGASKAAVKLFTEGLYSELQNTDVGVTIIFPGAIGTNIADNSGVTREQDAEPGGEEIGIDPLPPEKAAQQIIQAIEKNRFRALVGSDARLMDFLYRLAPRRAAKFIFKQMESLLG